jgi:hypothetical protein
MSSRLCRITWPIRPRAYVESWARWGGRVTKEHGGHTQRARHSEPSGPPRVFPVRAARGNTPAVATVRRVRAGRCLRYCLWPDRGLRPSAPAASVVANACHVGRLPVPLAALIGGYEYSARRSQRSQSACRPQVARTRSRFKPHSGIH